MSSRINALTEETIAALLLRIQRLAEAPESVNDQPQLSDAISTLAMTVRGLMAMVLPDEPPTTDPSNDID